MMAMISPRIQQVIEATSLQTIDGIRYRLEVSFREAYNYVIFLLHETFAFVCFGHSFYLHAFSKCCQEDILWYLCEHHKRAVPLYYKLCLAQYNQVYSGQVGFVIL